MLPFELFRLIKSCFLIWAIPLGMRRSGVLLRELARFYSGPKSIVLLIGIVLEMLLGFCRPRPGYCRVRRLFAFDPSMLKLGDPCIFV